MILTRRKKNDSKMTLIRENDRVFVSEMLFYLKNKLATTPKNVMIDICVKFYSVEEISKEKEKFENALNVRLSRRHGNDDYASKTLGDIIDKMIAVDSAGETSPVFVARDLTRNPIAAPSADSHVSLDMLLASIHDMKCTIRKMQTEMVTKDSLETSIMRYNRKDASDIRQNNANSVDVDVDAAAAALGATGDGGGAAAATPVRVDAGVESAAEAIVALASSSESVNINSWNGVVRQKIKTAAPNPSSNKNPRQRPPARKSSTVVIGTSVNAGRISLKGADLTVAKYIGYLDNETQPEDIRALLDEHQVETISLDPIPQKHNRFKSFKLVVKKSQLSIVEDGKIWPEGVLVGRFWSPKSTNPSSSETTNG